MLFIHTALDTIILKVNAAPTVLILSDQHLLVSSPPCYEAKLVPAAAAEERVPLGHHENGRGRVGVLWPAHPTGKHAPTSWSLPRNDENRIAKPHIPSPTQENENTSMSTRLKASISFYFFYEQFTIASFNNAQW